MKMVPSLSGAPTRQPVSYLQPAQSMKTKIHLISFIALAAILLITGCAGPAYRHDNRVDYRDDRQDDRYDRRDDRW